MPQFKSVRCTPSSTGSQACMQYPNKSCSSAAAAAFALTPLLPLLPPCHLPQAIT
jgi:hypothetical protein